LAQSRFSSNTADMIDVAAVMEAFEEINQVKITLSISLEGTGSQRGLRFAAVAEDRKHQDGVPVILASVSLTYSATNLKTAEAAVMHTLYMLDGRIAYQELHGSEPKKL
jgi:hypothetical protein